MCARARQLLMKEVEQSATNLRVRALMKANLLDSLYSRPGHRRFKIMPTTAIPGWWRHLLWRCARNCALLHQPYQQQNFREIKEDWRQAHWEQVCTIKYSRVEFLWLLDIASAFIKYEWKESQRPKGPEAEDRPASASWRPLWPCVSCMWNGITLPL